MKKRGALPFIIGAIGAGLVAAVLLLPKKAWGWVRGVATQIELVDVGNGFKLRADAAQAFQAMRAAAGAAGVFFQVNSGFRTMEEQQALYARYQAGEGALAAEPGFSNHQGGTAVDIETAGGTNAAYRWLVANGARFGFRRTVSSEPWHWEYV